MAATNINLLPVDLSAKSGVAKSASLFRRITVTGAIIFVILGILAGGFVVIFTLQINSVTKANDALKTQIASFETAEQKNVLVKDRLAKIKTIEGQKDILGASAGVGTINSSLPSGVSISDVNIDSTGKTQFGFTVSDSTSLVPFLANLVTAPSYKQLTIKNFSFNPATGYLVSFDAQTK